MVYEIAEHLSGWTSLDTWIVITAALAAMACALPGNLLLLRRQSMMGDALSHVALPGIVLAFLLSHWLQAGGWMSRQMHEAILHPIFFAGAMALGVLSAVLTEWVQKLGRVESSASLGAVFTTLFALGLLLMRAFADNVDIDPDCVLYGTIETVIVDTWPGTNIPRAAVINGAALLGNLALIVLFYKELKISAFDPALATTLGVNATVMHYALMAVTSVTLVAAFESVGSILVIAMLVTPAATAHLLTDRLSSMLGISLVVAAASALLGHAMAIALPPVFFSRIGFPADVGASTAGMMGVAVGILLVGAAFLSPRYGVLSRSARRFRLRLRIVADDILGLLYRLNERGSAEQPRTFLQIFRSAMGVGRLQTFMAFRWLCWRGDVAIQSGYCSLTPAGESAARRLVRSHRLWEAYVEKHFGVPQSQLHHSAERAEHYLSPRLQEELAGELESPQLDPHGRPIPKPDNPPPADGA